MPRLFRVIAYSTGSSKRPRVAVLRFSSRTRSPTWACHWFVRQAAYPGMSLLGPEFRRDHRAPFSSLTLSGTVVFWSLRRTARCPRSWHSRNLRGGRDRVVDGNTTNSPRRRVHSGTGATFSRAAPQRPWQCRLDTGVPLATGRCEWRAASASKSARLRRVVSDVPVATLRTPLGDRCAAGHKTHPPSPFVSFPGFLSLESLTQCARFFMKCPHIQ